MKKNLVKMTARRVERPVGKKSRAARVASRKPVARPVEAAPPEVAEMGDVAAIEADAEALKEETEADTETEAQTEAPEEPAVKRVAEDEPTNFLSMYFRDMARLAVLRPQEEFEAARQLEQLEIATWARAFSYPLVVDLVAKVLEHEVPNNAAEVELKTLRRLAARPGKKYEEAVLKVAAKVHALDVDKLFLDVVLAELKKVYRGLPGRVIDDKPSFSITSKRFRDYLRDVAAAYNSAHAAKNDFVKANLRLVVSIARRFNYGRMPLADLIQEGNIGLIKAVERFDYRRGWRFSTYASWWIRHAITRALADKGRAVRLPVHMIDAYNRVAKMRRKLTGTLGRQPTSEEIAAETGIATAKIEKMRTFLLDQSLSLDRPVSDEDGRKFIDFIQDPNAEERTTADDMVEQAMNDEVRAQLHNLKPIEADILRQRFGLDSDKELTLKEIGEKYNLSRERIRQLQEQALMKMRRALQRKDLA
jgi:RNA polymerase primary sigma factor